MNISCKSIVATAALSLCSLGIAQTKLPSSAPAKAAAARAPLDLTFLLKAVDTNKDGCMSHKEWQAAGLPESSYKGLADANHCVTLKRMQIGPAPDGIDLNGDGKLTVEEFREFDRKMAPLMKNRRAEQPAASPH
jgi:hypothetical protein